MTERGRVKWFNNRAGWGFIAREDAEDVFVRHDQIEGDGYKVLHEGDSVEFELAEGQRGLYATRVVRLHVRRLSSQENHPSGR
jgi:CspA family cold shock protein